MRLFLIFLGTLCIICANYVPIRDNNKKYKLCRSRICTEAGYEMIKSLDQSIDPCDNFYNHACGGWVKNHPVPEGQYIVTQFDLVETRLREQLKEILQKNEMSASETLHKMREYYRSCLDLAAINARGLSPLESIVMDNGGWPLTLPSDMWRFDNTNLTLQKIHENYFKVVGTSALFVIEVVPHTSMSTINLLVLKPPISPLNRQNAFLRRRKKKDTKSFTYDQFTLTIAAEFARLRGFNVSAGSINEDLKHLYEFEFLLNQLYSSVATDDFDDGKIYQLMTIAELQKTWDRVISRREYNINWLETIQSAFDETGIEIDATQEISVPRENVENLAYLLETSPLRTVVNYVHWHAIDRLVLFTNIEMQEISNVMYKIRYGHANNDDQRYIVCIDNHIMPEALSYAWVKEYFDKNMSLAIMGIVSQIQAEMKRQFDLSTWMDDEAKLRSKQKITNMMKYIGYPSWYDDPGKIDEYYNKQTVGPNFFENMVNYNRFKTITAMTKLSMRNVRHEDVQSHLSGNVNTYYSPDLNSLIYPAVMFQVPFFHIDRPLILNYGHVGTVVGHEIAHGFGIKGINYDEVGIQKKWWSDSTIARHTDKVQCLIDQYSTYTLFEHDIYETIKINGTKTVEENVADNVGFTIALKAYLSYQKNHSLEDIRIPVLQNYTDEMIFFYSLSNTYCASEHPEAAEKIWFNSFYSPYAKRINGALSNMPEFSKAFNCPRGSPMNPVKKCTIWDDKLCETQICEEAGNEIVKSIDQSIDPCNNFFEHACGGWIANHPIPEGQIATSQFGVVEIKLQEQLKAILRKNETSDSETLRKVKDYYRSCEDLVLCEAAIDARGLSPLKPIVSANGGWPIGLRWNNSHQENQNLTLQKIHDNYAKVTGSSALFVISVVPYSSITGKHLLKLKPPVSLINQHHLFVLRGQNKCTPPYAYDPLASAVVTDLAKLQGFEVPSANIQNVLDNIYEFGCLLNKLYSSVPRNDFDNGTFYRVATIAEVQNMWNEAVSSHDYEIDWLKHIRSEFDGTGIMIEATEEIQIPRENILEELAHLLESYHDRTVVNYIHWHAIKRLVSYTNKKMRETNGFFKNHDDPNNDDQRSTFCINNHIMPEGLFYAWLQEYMGEHITPTIIDMVSQIQEEMNRQFDRSTWMDDETKFRFKDKIDNLRMFAGYPNYHNEPRAIDEIYSELVVGPNYFENVINYNRFRKIKLLRKLRKPYDRYDARRNDLSIQMDVSNYFEQNSKNFPAMMFQMPFFQAGKPMALQYGSMGAAIGYDITRRLGIQGDFFYTYEGRSPVEMHENVEDKKKMWLNRTIAKYNEKTKCFVDQYSNYTLSEELKFGLNNIDDEKIFQQNIADNNGFAIPIRAYLSYKKKYNFEDIKIPALQSYTDEKLFFYSLSNYYCMSERQEVVQLLSYDKMHRPAAVTINGAVSNMREFSEAFNCPIGSPMNPVKKCILWDDNLCESKICEEAGNEIVKSIDQSVDPCNNFYEHACGGWIANHPIPEGQIATSQFEVNNIKLQEQLREILRKNETSDRETLRKVKDYYRSCEDLAAIDARGLSPLESIVLANGGWPLTVPLNNWSLADQNLTLQKIHEDYGKVSGSSALFYFKVVPSTLKTGINILKLKPPVTPTNRQGSSISQRKKRYLRTTYYDNYALTVANDFAELRGFNVSSDDIFNDVLQIFQFEYSLINLDYGTQYRVTTIAEVQNTWNTVISGRPEYAIDWLETIRSAFDGTGIVINATEQIQVPGANFLEKLGVLLKAYPLRSVVNYVHWHAIDSLVSYTNKKMRDLSNILFASRNEYVYNDNQRSTFCIDQHTMRLGLSYAYVREYFGKNSLQTIINMVYQIQEEMSHQFYKSGWIDGETKFRLEKRLRNMTVLVGYPNYYDEPGKIDEFYNKLVVGPDYFENIVNYNKFSTITLLKELREPYDEYDIGLDFLPTQLNMLSDLDLNIISFPAAILQMPNFHAERPMVLNYGSIGAAIGYEISNALVIEDRINTKFYKNKKSLTNPTMALYHERAKCFVDQYSNYTLSDNSEFGSTHINGEITLEQNIADNTGFAIALKVYLSYKKKYNFEDIKIPALQSYTDEKLFFYSLSNYYCTSEMPAFVEYLWFDRKHCPAAVRVNGVLSNMPEFSETFNCPIGSPMNPVKKCVFWN